MEFISTEMEVVSAVGLLDTKERVVQLRLSLNEATEESFEKLARAKTACWQESHEIVMD